MLDSPRRRRRCRSGIILPAALVVLVATLARLQYHWLGQVSEAERDAVAHDRCSARAVSDFADDFDRSHSRCVTFSAPQPTPRSSPAQPDRWRDRIAVAAAAALPRAREERWTSASDGRATTRSRALLANPTTLRAGRLARIAWQLIADAAAIRRSTLHARQPRRLPRRSPYWPVADRCVDCRRSVIPRAGIVPGDEGTDGAAACPFGSLGLAAGTMVASHAVRRTSLAHRGPDRAVIEQRHAACDRRSPLSRIGPFSRLPRRCRQRTPLLTDAGLPSRRDDERRRATSFFRLCRYGRQASRAARPGP